MWNGIFNWQKYSNSLQEVSLFFLLIYAEDMVIFSQSAYMTYSQFWIHQKMFSRNGGILQTEDVWFHKCEKIKVHLTVAKQRIFDNYKSLLADIYLF